jgi:hypothetical protein
MLSGDWKACGTTRLDQKSNSLKLPLLSGKVRGRLHGRNEGVPNVESNMRCFIVMMNRADGDIVCRRE